MAWPSLSPAAGTTSAAAARPRACRAAQAPCGSPPACCGLCSGRPAEPSLTRALAACVGSALSTCLPVSPPCLPQAPPAPSQEQLSLPQGTISMDTPSPGLLLGSRGPLAIQQWEGHLDSPQPLPAHLRGSRCGAPLPQAVPLGPPVLCDPRSSCSCAGEAGLRAGLCTHPSSHSCPMRTPAHPPACPLLSWSTHASQTQGTSSGPVGLPPRALTLGLGVRKSRGGMGFLESHQHPCQPLPGWLTTAGMGLSPRGLSPRCQERRNKAARWLSAQSEIESGGEGGFSSLVSGNPMP